MSKRIDDLLRELVQRDASDLHIKAGNPPLMRIRGDLKRTSYPALDEQEVTELMLSILTEDRRERLFNFKELDLSYHVAGLSRFRVNMYWQRGKIGAVFRVIPFKIRTIDELNMPIASKRIAIAPRGLVLVTGPTGSGKSTSLAAMIDEINQKKRCHIMTIEDPIEFYHSRKRAIVNQREVGRDTDNFKGALKYVLRQDPDVVLIGEMRDLETIEAALTISETGHLVFGTLHTNSAISTINRVIDVFPPHQQDQVRTKLSFVLQGVLSQQLVPKTGQPGRALALEVLTMNPAIRNLIREGKVQQLYSQMQVGQEKFGMQTLNQSLYVLWAKRLISQEEAFMRSVEPDELRMMFERKAPPRM